MAEKELKPLEDVYALFIENQHLLEKEEDFLRFEHLLSSSYEKEEDMKTVSKTCTIEKDWVEMIDETMPYLFRCVEEQRQFVRSDGIVLPIDRVKVVNKESVADLAKHSNYITHEPDEEGRIIPDKLMMAKKEDDYAVYENRFLYTLLTYLNDFIEARLKKILDLSGLFTNKSEVIKKTKAINQDLEFHIEFLQSKKEDELVYRKETLTAVNMLKKALNDVNMLLQTPLMKYVAGSQNAKISFPIIKTNVLLYDRNFKKALQLFEYLKNYNRDGYQIQTEEKTLNPYPPSFSKQFDVLLYLVSFLTYIHANNLEEDLRRRNLEKETERKEKEKQELLSRIDFLMEKVQRSGISLEEYALQLEKALKLLKKDLEDKKKEVITLDKEYALQFEKIEKEHQLELDIKEKEKEEAMQKLQEEHQQVLSRKEDVIRTLQEEKEAIKEDKERELKTKDREYERLIESIQTKHENRIEEQKLSYEKKQKELEDTISSNNKEIEELKSRLFAKEVTTNNIEPSQFSGELSFDELERQKKEFDAFYKKAWKEAKAQIRKDVYGPKKKEKKK